MIGGSGDGLERVNFPGGLVTYHRVSALIIYTMARLGSTRCVVICLPVSSL